MPTEPTQTPETLTERIIRERYFPVSRRALNTYVAAGKFPPHDFKVSGVLRFWHKRTIENWLAAQGDRAGAAK